MIYEVYNWTSVLM